MGDLTRTAAWKYAGYPAITKYMASSSDCLALRRFRSLNIRALLKLQNDIVGLERQLHDLDEHSKGQPRDAGGCGSFRLDINSPREETLDELGVLLHEYNVRIAAFLQIEDRPSASPAQVQNLQNWLANHPNAIEEPEQEFLLTIDDLFAQRTPKRTHFGCWMQALGLRRVAKLKSDDSTAYYNQNLWRSAGGLLFLIAILALFLGPMWIVAFVHKSIDRLVSVTAFSVGFGILLTIGTTFKSSQRGFVLAGYLVFLALILGLSPGWAVGQPNRQDSQGFSPLATSSAPVSGSSSMPQSLSMPPSTISTSPGLSSTQVVSSILTQSNAAQTSPSAASSNASRATADDQVSSYGTPSSSTTPSATPASKSSSGLSAGAKAGIGVGVAVGAIPIIAMIIMCCHRR